MIQSVTSKAEDLLQAQPASEISSKYETLSKHAKELYAKQKETVEQHQAFIDAGNDFMQWIRAAKEKLSKCSEPTGDKESLSSKVSQLKVGIGHSNCFKTYTFSDFNVKGMLGAIPALPAHLPAIVLN